MREIDEVSAYEMLLCRIAPLGIAYLHMLIEPSQPAFAAVRTQWEGTLVLNTPRASTRTSRSWRTSPSGASISAAAVGRAFLANPDLIERLSRAPN